MADKLKVPSEKTIKFLYQGIVSFYPDVATAVFSLPKQDRLPSVFWGGFNEPDFESFLRNITGNASSIDEAAAVVNGWTQGTSLEKTIPENLDKLVEDLDETNKKSGANVGKINLARRATIESQKFVEKSSGAISSDIEIDKDFFVKLTPSVLKTFEQAAQGAITFPLKVTSFFATPGYREENPNASAAVSSAINLTTLERATKANQSLSDKERAKILAFVETFRKARYSFIDQLKTEQLRASVHGIVFANGSDLGLSQAEWFVLLEPSSSYQPSGRRGSLFGGLIQQIFGNAAEKAVTSTANKVFGEAAKKLASQAMVKVGGKALTQAILQTIGSSVPIIGNIVAYLVGELAPKIIGWLKRNLNKIAGVVLIAGALLVGGPIGLLMGVGGALSFVGTTGLGTAASVVGNSLSFGITSILLPSIGPPILISLLSIPIVVALILFIINSGAYIVPPGGGFLQGGIIEPCPEGGQEITSSLASKIQGGIVKLLPASNGARATHFCITPTMVILHSTSGYDNNEANDTTYGVLAGRDRACQLATDTNDTYLMQPFYEKQVEMAWCANSWNAYGISIEIAGECSDGPSGKCSRTASACSPNYPLTFSNPPPHPCAPESDLALNAVCSVMKQYSIPWCQVYTHDDVPDATHTDPEGKDWVYNYFMARLKRECPSDPSNLCYSK